MKIYQNQKTPSLSPLTLALLDAYKKGAPKPPPEGTPLLTVSSAVSFAAILYEKMRNAVEFRDEHLIRRASIERILKRRLLLNESGKGIAEFLIRELIWARYLKNNFIPETKIPDIQNTIDKYVFLKNKIIVGRPREEKKQLAQFILEVASCEIEEKLAPYPRREAFANYIYQIMRTRIAFVESKEDQEKDIQVYIGVERAFAKSDEPLISYHLFKMYFPQIYNCNWEESEVITPELYQAIKKIKKEINHPLSFELRKFIQKQTPPFLILKALFEEREKEIEKIVPDEKLLKKNVDEICRKKYQETGIKLRRAGIRSIIYIFLTKMVFALLIEYPFDKYFNQKIALAPMAINTVFPPILMGLIVLVTHIPGEENTLRILESIKEFLKKGANFEGKVTEFSQKKKKYRPFLTFSFSLIYGLAFLSTFGVIIYILTNIGFNLVGQAVFIFFLTVVTFFGYLVSQASREYLLETTEGILAPVTDFFTLPILRVGHLLSAEIAKLNFIIFFFDFVIEAPFKAVFEIIEEWIRFMRAKREELF